MFYYQGKRKANYGTLVYTDPYSPGHALSSEEDGGAGTENSKGPGKGAEKENGHIEDGGVHEKPGMWQSPRLTRQRQECQAGHGYCK